MKMRKIAAIALGLCSVAVVAAFLAANRGRGGDLDAGPLEQAASSSSSEELGANEMTRLEPLRDSRTVVPMRDHSLEQLTVRRFGEVDVLSIDGSGRADGSSWVLRSFAGEQDSNVVAGQSVEVGVGEWRVLPAGEQPWRPVNELVVVVEEERTIIWVVSPYDINLKVTDIVGLPLEGVSVYWDKHRQGAVSSQRIQESPGPLEPVGTTDAQGGFQLTDLVSVAGDLRVVAEGYTPKTLSFSGAVDRSIELKLSASTGIRRARLRSFQEDWPVEGASIYDSHGILLGTSDESGVVEIPAWVGDRDVLYLVGGGVFPMYFLGSSLAAENTLVLATSQQLRISTEGNGAQHQGTHLPISCLIDMNAWPSDTLGTPMAELVYVISLPQSDAVMLPRDVECRLQAVDSSGMESEVLICTVSRDGELHLDLKTLTAGLSVVAKSDQGEVHAFSVQAELREGNHWTGKSTDNSPLVIPWIDKIQSFDVSAKGYGTVRLYARFRAVLSGMISVDLPRGGSVEVEVHDPEGRALRGIELRVSAEDTTPPGMKTDSLGRRDSDHPGWYIAEPMVQAQVTGSDGRAFFSGLAAGRYLLWPRRPKFLDGARGRIRIDALRPTTFIVGPNGAHITVELPRSRHVALFLFDEVSGIELDSFNVFLTSGMPSQRVRVKGAIWEGWVPMNGGSIVITAPGYHEARFSPEELAEGELHYVRLSPAKSCAISLVGDALPEEVEVRFVRKSADRQGSQWESVQEVRLVAVSDGIVHLQHHAGSEILFARLSATSPDGGEIDFFPRDVDLSQSDTQVVLVNHP